MRNRTLLPAVLAGLLAPLSAHAQFPEGARALGMGGAFTAVADDMYSPFWNPAGAAQLRGTHMVIAGVTGSLTGPLKLSDITSNFPSSTGAQVNLIEKLSGGESTLNVSADFGIGHNGFLFSAAPVAVGTVTTTDFVNGQPTPGATGTFQGAVGLRYLFTYGRWVTPTVAVGANLNVMSAVQASTTVAYDAQTNRFNTIPGSGNSPTTTTISGDFGYLQKISDTGRVGAMVKNLIGPDNQGLNPQRLDVGWSDRPFGKHLLFAADFQNVGASGTLGRFNFGAEGSYGMFALRGGLYRGRPTIGVGLGQYIDFAYGDNGALAGLHFGF